MFEYFEILGFTAGIFTTMAFIPQILKIMKTKKTDDFSYLWLIMTMTGVTLWFFYGLIINSQPVVIFNFLSLIFVCFIIIFKFIVSYVSVKSKTI